MRGFRDELDSRPRLEAGLIPAGHLRHISIAMTTLLSCALTVACALHGHRLDFSALEQADYIEVRSNLNAPIKTIDDSNQVRAATQFIEQYRGGWKDPAARAAGAKVHPDLL